MLRLLELILKIASGVVADSLRSRQQLLAENAMLRQQVINLRRAVKRPRLTPTERLLLVISSCLTKRWRRALHIVRPDTLLRWHRDLFRLRWRFLSRRSKKRLPRLDAELIELIRRMASNNHTWGCERIRGELFKLGFRVGKRTIQRYVRGIRPDGGRGQTWQTFLQNHQDQIWACDFLQLYDFAFRPIFAFFIVRLDSRPGRSVQCYSKSVGPVDRPAASRSDAVRRRPSVPHSR